MRNRNIQNLNHHKRFFCIIRSKIYYEEYGSQNTLSLTAPWLSSGAPSKCVIFLFIWDVYQAARYREYSVEKRWVQVSIFPYALQLCLLTQDEWTVYNAPMDCSSFNVTFCHIGEKLVLLKPASEYEYFLANNKCFF